MQSLRKIISFTLVMAMAVGVLSFSAPANAEAKTKLYKITGDSSITVDQMVSHYKKHASYPKKVYKKKGAPTIKDFCEIIYEEAEAENIKAEVVYAQVIEETGYLKFGGDVKPSQCNFAGLGATGGGKRGEKFSSVRMGIRAQVQHLKAYANKQHLEKKCVDKRFKYVKRGSAKYVKWLGYYENPYGEGWAYSRGYGGRLKSIIKKVKKC